MRRDEVTAVPDPEDTVRLTLKELMAMTAARVRAHGDE